jgi:hypothetical protein
MGMSVNVTIDIDAMSLSDARELLEVIAADIERGKFSACCTKEQQDKYGGAVFVTEDE